MFAVRLSRRLVLPCFLAVSAPTLLGVRASRAQSSGAALERAIRATYLWKFAPFIEWPLGTFASADSPLVICVLGDDALADLLDQAVAGQTISGRSIVVRRLRAVSANSGCQILFDAGSPAQSVTDALTAVRGTPVLTVTDADDHGGPKGIINFVVADNHVRFEINDRAAASNRLAISSKLLSLAVTVTPRTEMRPAVGIA